MSLYRSTTMLCRNFGNACFLVANRAFRDMQVMDRLASTCTGPRRDTIDLGEYLGQSCCRWGLIADRDGVAARPLKKQLPVSADEGL